MFRTSKKWKPFLALTSIALTLALAPGCAMDGELQPDDEANQELGPDELALGVTVVLDGEEYSAAEIAELGMSPIHYVSTYESIRDGYVLAFTTLEASDEFRASYPVAELRRKYNAEQSLFPRKNSKFYDLVGFGDKFLELGPGESAVDLGTHPCHCDQDISSLKASETATWTRVYDFVNFGGDTWSIPSGAEIQDLGNYFHNGSTWNQDISSIKVIQ